MRRNFRKQRLRASFARFVPVRHEPPNRGESLDDNQIIKRRLKSKAVVKKQRLSEFKDFPVMLARAGEAVTRIFFADCGIIHDTTGISDELAFVIVEWNRNAVFEKPARAET